MRAARDVHQEEHDPFRTRFHGSHRHQPSTTETAHESSIELRRGAQRRESLIDNNGQTPSSRRLSLLSKNYVRIKKKQKQAKRELVRNHIVSPTVRYL
jgi:hypothetical protein